jgi:hypothetical protein
MNWARYHPNGYEVSSRGNTRYSALYAKLSDGLSIEEAYQLDVKGWRAVSENWRDGKGNAPWNGKSRAELWSEYLELWRQWVHENPTALSDLQVAAKGKVLTDMFATSDINQAHALSVLITEQESLNQIGGLKF